MVTLPIDFGEIDALLLRLNALMAKEATDIPNPGGNASDDEIPETLQETADDLTSDELVQEIEALNDDQQDALVALFWIGRGDAEPEDWEETMALARQRHTGPASTYLLGKPLVSGFIAEGVERMREAGELD